MLRLMGNWQNYFCLRLHLVKIIHIPNSVRKQLWYQWARAEMSKGGRYRSKADTRTSGLSQTGEIIQTGINEN